MFFFSLGFLNGVRGKFTEDVSKTAVGSIFTGHEYEFILTHLIPSSLIMNKNTFLLMASEGGTHSGFRNVVGKFSSHTVQRPKTKKQDTSRIFLHLSANATNMLTVTVTSVCLLRTRASSSYKSIVTRSTLLATSES
jgi:hypothetical protein